MFGGVEPWRGSRFDASPRKPSAERQQMPPRVFCLCARGKNAREFYRHELFIFRTAVVLADYGCLNILCFILLVDTSFMA